MNTSGASTWAGRGLAPGAISISSPTLTGVAVPSAETSSALLASWSTTCCSNATGCRKPFTPAGLSPSAFSRPIT